MSAQAERPLLEIRGVSAFYGKIQALRDVDMTVNRGEIVTMIGANGAGKSTLMMTIFGRPRARSGRIIFDGTDITGMPAHEIARMGLAQSPEPSLGLAPLLVKQIFDVIRELNEKERLTVFLVEQNAFHALKLAHRGYVLVNGRVTMSGTGEELLSKEEVRAAYLEGGV